MDRMEMTDDFQTLEAAVRRHVLDALALAQGNQRRAAVLLGVSRWTLARMVKRFELGPLVATMRSEGEKVTGTLREREAPEPASVVMTVDGR